MSRKTRCQILCLIVFTIGTGLILRGQVPLEVGRREWANLLPDGEGKGLVLGTCTQCHSLNPVALQRKSAKAWELCVRDMISRGAQIHAEEIAPITGYLARSFGPDAPLANVTQAQPISTIESGVASNTGNSADTLPNGEGKAFVLSACTSCHVLRKTTEARKDEAGWRGNVKDMVRLGAKLRPDEESVLVAYLVKHFGRQGPSESEPRSNVQPPNSSVMAGVARTSSPPDPARLLPDDEGKGLILATCVQCHASLGYVLGTKKTSKGWRHSVDDMISRGAQVTPQEADIIVNYLVKHMGQDKKVE